MPRIDPATAVAISHRKNSCPRSYRSATAIRISGCPAVFERVDCSVLRLIRLRHEAQVDKHPIIAVHVRRAGPLSIDRNQPPSELTRGFSEQLFEPGTETTDPRRRHEMSPCPDRGCQASRARARAQPLDCPSSARRPHNCAPSPPRDPESDRHRGPWPRPAPCQNSTAPSIVPRSTADRSRCSENRAARLPAATSTRDP